MVAAHTSRAANGMNMIGFGAESTSMGGADLAVTDSPAAMNINPAGISQCSSPEVAFGLGHAWPSVENRDQLGNEQEDELDRIPMPFLAYVHPVGRFTLGAGLFVQGGLGAEYGDLVTPMSALKNSLPMLPPGFSDGDLIPDRDEARTRVMFAKFTPTVAWQINPEWSVGASLNVGYARADMKLFPETSVDAEIRDMSGNVLREVEFFGMNLEDTSAFGYGGRVGFQYRKGNLMLGGAYFTETALDLDDGTMTLNLSALGLGKVKYDAAISDFAWPRRAGLGAAYHVSPLLLISADVDWIDWSSAIERLTIKVKVPANSPPEVPREIPFEMNWKDQWVFAVGMEITPAAGWALRFGYNHGDTPIPNDFLRPMFPAIGEDHFTGGLGVTKGRWTFDMGVEYVLKAKKTNDSRDPAVNPFGPGSRESLSQFMAHFMLRVAFPR
jgi:long-chain fatty acid transport protein